MFRFILLAIQTIHIRTKYNAFNVYRRELAPGTVSLTGDRAQGDDSKHWAYNRKSHFIYFIPFYSMILTVSSFAFCFVKKNDSLTIRAVLCRKRA